MESFQVATDWLDHLASEAQFFRKKEKPSLDVVKALLVALGDPDKSFEYRVIVGGTAGKGTVCKRVESVLCDEGMPVVALYSPHIIDVRERISINGEMIDEALFTQMVSCVKDAAEKISVMPTYYEAIVLAGILAGKEIGATVCIAEVGLGGRLDAVNALRGKRVSAVTFIGDDHRDILGPELSDIAREKAGIFTEDCVLCLSYEQEYCSIFDNISKLKIQYIKGIKQKLNKKIAQKIVKFILQKEVVMKPIQLRARWEVTKDADDQDRKIIFDGAHSQPRFEFILPKIKKLSQKPILVAAMTKNHDLKAFECLRPYIDSIVWTTVSGERDFWSPEALEAIYKTGTCIEDPKKALAYAKETSSGPILVTGSFYLCSVLLPDSI